MKKPQEGTSNSPAPRLPPPRSSDLRHHPIHNLFRHIRRQIKRTAVRHDLQSLARRIIQHLACAALPQMQSKLLAHLRDTRPDKTVPEPPARNSSQVITSPPVPRPPRNAASAPLEASVAPSVIAPSRQAYSAPGLPLPARSRAARGPATSAPHGTSPVAAGCAVPPAAAFPPRRDRPLGIVLPGAHLPGRNSSSDLPRTFVQALETPAVPRTCTAVFLATLIEPRRKS